jgi:hypothetical protein
MLLMMHKAQEALATWAVEERAQQDKQRYEERAKRLRIEDLWAKSWADKHRANAMEVVRHNEVRQANKERDLLCLQAKLYREVADHQMKMERKAAKEWAKQAAEDCKQECQEAEEKKSAELKREREREDQADQQQQSASCLKWPWG